MTESLLEIKLNTPDDFLKIKETLSRIGIASHKDKKLYQSCHILHKKGHYFCVHFKEMFALDKKNTSISENDLARRNTIALLLEEWGLCTIPNKPENFETVPVNTIKILPFKEKENWTIVQKYTLGVKRTNKD
jgi:hypothetical protein